MSPAYVRAIALGIFLIVAGIEYSPLCDEVGERAPSPSPGVPTATARADSEAAPARSPHAERGTEADWARDALPCGVATPASSPTSSSCPPQGEDGGTALRYPPASTVTQSALTATVTATVVIDPVPATPPAQRVPVGSYDPWPTHLWPVVECLIQRESKGDPYAVGLAGERGLMQVHPITWGYLARYGITPDALFDPATNIRAAFLLYIEAGGLRPWGGGCA